MDNVSEALLVLVVGMGGVFGSLIFFYLVISLLNKIDSYFVKKEERIRAGGLQESKKIEAELEQTQDEADDDELMAVITAAAFAATDKQIIVKKIQFLNQPTSNAWAQAGRLGIMASHNVQKTN